MKKHSAFIVAVFAAFLWACASGGEHDISGTYVCDNDRHLELIIEPAGQEYSVKVMRTLENGKEMICTYQLDRSNHEGYVIWTDPDHSSYFKVKISSNSLKGFYYNTKEQSVTQAVLTKTGHVSSEQPPEQP
jgi:hypothetical protein